MNYIELKQKEFFLKYISNKLSKELQNNINLEFIIKYNDKIITGTTLCNFNTNNFSVETILNDFNNPRIIFDSIDTFYIYEHIKPFHINYLRDLFKLSKTHFKSVLLNLILHSNSNLDFKKDNFELYNVKFIENNIALDYLLVSEKDNFEIVSVNIID